MNELVYLLAGLVLLLVVAVDSPFMYLVYKSGKLAKSRIASRINNHVRWGNRFLLMMIVTVLLIKMMTTVKYGEFFGELHLMDTRLGEVHLAADFVFTILAAAMKFYFKGTTWPGIHTILAYLLIFSYVIIVVTGVPLVVELVR